MAYKGPGGTLLFSSPTSRRASSAPPPPSLPGLGATVGGRYRLVEQLGEGQFGRVYRAERTDLPQHHVALKVLESRVYAGRDAEQELRLLSAVAHPHIVQLADHGVEPGHVWFTMPLYQGQPLDALAAERKLTPREAYDVFSPIAEGLEVLHAVGLRHQDVKPDNIFLASFQRTRFPLLLDLGAAAPARAAHPAAGTLLFAAPEQVRALMACVRGELHREALTEAVDTYNLAATLLWSLVGPRQFPGHEAEQAADLVEAEEILVRASLERATRPLRPGALPGLPSAARDALSEALARWMSLDPAARPPMKQVRAQLGVLLESDALRHRRQQLRKAAAWALGAASLVGGLGLAAQQQKEQHLRRCTAELLSTQQGAVETVSDLGQCKGLLSAQASEAQQCKSDLGEQGRRLQEAERRRGGVDSSWWQARAERCEGERRAAAASCTAETEALVREQTAVAMERDLLRSERDQLKARLPAQAAAGAHPAASATAPAAPAASAPAAAVASAPAAPERPRVGPRAKR